MPTPLVLVSPYLGARPLDRHPPPRGSVLALDLANRADRLLELHHWARRAPWCPMCVVLSSGQVSASDLLHHAPYPDAWVPVLRSEGGEFPGPARLLQAVRGRPVPTPAAVGAYVAHRRGRPALAEYVEACARECSEPAHGAYIPERTLRERLRRHALPGVRIWRMAFTLVRMFADDAHHPGRSLERLAADHGIDSRTVRAWCLKLSGLPAAEVRSLAGWEWLVESVLEVRAVLDAEDAG